jgi:hypothetical protein
VRPVTVVGSGSPSTPTTATATCAAGEVATGGGCSATAIAGGGMFTGFIPTSTSYTCAFSSRATVTAYVVCAPVVTP